MINAAKEYCLLVEHLETYQNNQWLADAARILPRIQASMAYLDDSEIEYSYFALPDLEDRFELYCQLKDRFGDDDAYWLEYDSNAALEEITGSLASDFSDIYFELKRGLNLLNTGGGEDKDVLRLWQTGYVLNWGQHLLNAQKHLYSLRVEFQYKMD
jgi:hypothetical protein